MLALREAAVRAGVCRRTLERLLAEGAGPARVQMSPRRVGILEADPEAWLSRRTIAGVQPDTKAGLEKALADCGKVRNSWRRACTRVRDELAALKASSGEAAAQ
jgi:predicted DNA-binding transcriptional regulator AlpA